ncbi:MAG: dihydrofolate reductase family protein [Nanoarchaeota archaeon]
MSNIYLDEYPKTSYDYDKIKLKKIFENSEVTDYPNEGIQTKNSKKVFGEIKFPEFPDDRAYTMASFVTSIDGKVAFLDRPQGPIVAKSNALDPDGAEADFWVLNLMRANSDAVFVGAGTMQKEPDGLICIFDEELEKARIKNGLNPTPWAVICSLDGTDIPFEDSLIDNQPVLFNTSPSGLEVIKDNLGKDYYVVGPYKSENQLDLLKIKSQFEDNKYKKIPVIVTGEDNLTDSYLVLKILKTMGFDKAMVESPSYCHALLGDGLLDEMILNYSCVYIGGDAVGLGDKMEPYTSKKHPHSEMITIHSHSPSFFYFRHKFVYGLEPEFKEEN